jgi:hypothetical protein
MAYGTRMPDNITSGLLYETLKIINAAGPVPQGRPQRHHARLTLSPHV